VDKKVMQFFFAKVMHQRLFPKRNGFLYGIYYVSIPLKSLETITSNWFFGLNRLAFMSFYTKDHGYRDGQSLQAWCDDILRDYGVSGVTDVTLLAMPRVFGHVFNPVSFWFCCDQDKNVKAIICEVNNTFGETHSYLCVVDGSFIQKEIVLKADKIFHVSPFLQRQGHYEFRFDVTSSKAAIWIDFFDADGRKQLVTSLVGDYADFNRQNSLKAFLCYPMVSTMALVKIHWHAVKLLVKGIRYIPKPLQLKEKISRAEIK
jgi:hypothetical protein